MSTSCSSRIGLQFLNCGHSLAITLEANWSCGMQRLLWPCGEKNIRIRSQEWRLRRGWAAEQVNGSLHHSGTSPTPGKRQMGRAMGCRLATSQPHLLLMITLAGRRKMGKAKEDQRAMQSQERCRERRGRWSMVSESRETTGKTQRWCQRMGRWDRCRELRDQDRYRVRQTGKAAGQDGDREVQVHILKEIQKDRLRWPSRAQWWGRRWKGARHQQQHTQQERRPVGGKGARGT